MPASLCIFEDKKFSNFFPLSLSQPVFDLRIGFRTLRSRVADEFAEVSMGVICRDYLAAVTGLKTPDVAINQIPTAETIFLNGRLLCLEGELRAILDQMGSNSICVKGGYVVGARLSVAAAGEFTEYMMKRISEETLAQLVTELRALSNTNKKAGGGKRSKERSADASEGTYEDVHAVGQDSFKEKLPKGCTAIIDKHRLKVLEMPEARLLSFPWQLIEFNPDVIADDFSKLPYRGLSEESVLYPGVQLIKEEDIVIGEGTVVKSGVVLDASDGPIAIGDRTIVMPNASIIGPVSIGSDCVVKTGAKILGGTSTGNVCKIGGEVDGTIFGSYSNKQHDGFIGHSYIGEWVNIGAASNNSDLKNNYSAVRMWNAGAFKETGRQFMGLLMGDHTKTGINTVFNTGTVVGFNCNIYSSEMVSNFVPSYSWGHGSDMDEYDLTKAMQTAEVVMERRKVKFGEAHRTIFSKIHELGELSNRNI